VSPENNPTIVDPPVHKRKSISRRNFIHGSLSFIGLAGISGVISTTFKIENTTVLLPPGYKIRIVARSGDFCLANSDHRWHWAPDGGASFATDDDGWIYVSNSEMDNGGASALRFDRTARLIASYPILSHSRRNCSGGATPWKTWLSCEEVSDGFVWQCDPKGLKPAVKCPQLGRFWHEAIAVDPSTNQLYLTEDQEDGCLYRFTPHILNESGTVDLNRGILEVAIDDPVIQGLNWLPIEDPSGSLQALRYQVPNARHFNGGEGVWYFDHQVYFATKGDDCVRSYSIATRRLEIIYSANDYIFPRLTGVDAITIAPNGYVLVAEDQGDMEIIAITPNKNVIPLVKLSGHDGSEITGLAFNPEGNKLYFSSQRGETGQASGGITFEVSGDFDSPVWSSYEIEQAI